MLDFTVMFSLYCMPAAMVFYHAAMTGMSGMSGSVNKNAGGSGPFSSGFSNGYEGI